MKLFSFSSGFFFLTLFIAVFQGCAPQKGAPKTTNTVSVEQEESSNPSLPILKHAFTPQQAGEYEVRLSTENPGGFPLHLEKFSALDGHWFTVQIGEPKIDYVESGLKSSSRVHYRLKTFIQEQASLLSTLNLEVPIDWILESPTQWIPTTNLRRIFLKKTTLWIPTTENTKSIELPEIISEQGEIHLRSQSRKKHSLSLKIHSLKGSIRIGALGLDGLEGEEGKEGNPGETGASGEVGVAVLKNEPFLGIKTVGICIKKPTDGKIGKNGGKGEDGKKGGNGGPSPQVTLYSPKLENARVSFFVEPGAGGKGGKGGAGGIAGPGGPAGIQDHLKICPAAKQGPSGKAGESGKDGENGKPGQSYPIEWTL